MIVYTQKKKKNVTIDCEDILASQIGHIIFK